MKKKKNKRKRKPPEWEKIFTNEVNNKGLITKIYKHHLQLNIKKTNNPTKKYSEDLNRQFSKDTQMVKKTHEKMFSITHYQRKANQNYCEVPPYTSQNDHHQKVYKQ